MAETAGRDMYLRHWKLEIKDRPDKGPNMWKDRLTKRVMTEAEAIRLAKQRENASKA